MKSDLQTIIDEAMAEIPTNLTWDDEGIWKGWTYSLENNRYYFDDIGDESLTELWSQPFLRQGS
jgi:hypothetical protein